MSHSIASSPRHSRAWVRRLHLALSAVIGTLVYAPMDIVVPLRPVVQVSLFPVLALSGLWLWKGHLLRR